jgi:hypothetical protein
MSDRVAGVGSPPPEFQEAGFCSDVPGYQVPEATSDQLLVAFRFYYDRDAFIVFPIG